MSGENFGLKIEFIVVDIVKNRFREIIVEVDRLMKEKNAIKNGFDLQCEELNRLKEFVILLEEKESNLEILIVELKSENDGLVKEKRLRENFIEGVKKEKIDLEKMIEEKKKEIDILNQEIKELLSVKHKSICNRTQRTFS
ncbi:hypothetical protein V5N11_020906 [Cardamine amara subsp. amara]|uniref:Uncharacterized protein n=1 Tax=Cardamine amara subsp. amara TaxID=228776 RepID=A0ABD0Z8K7_CARAN